MRKKWFVALASILVIVGLILTVKYTRFYFIPKNFNVVEQDLYRGGKQTDRVFRELLDKYKFKTVVSLTGEFKEQEKAATDAGAKYIHYSWHGSGVGPFDEYQAVGALLKDTATRPALFHCYGGDKRCNAVTFAISLEEGMSPDKAFERLEQFGFSRTADTTLYQHLKDYAEWREQQLKDAKPPPATPAKDDLHKTEPGPQNSNSARAQ
jgi:hypothetical protein